MPSSCRRLSAVALYLNRIEEVQLQCFKAKTKETSSAADPATVFDRVNRFPSHPQIINDRLSLFANNMLPFALNLRGAAHIRK